MRAAGGVAARKVRGDLARYRLFQVSAQILKDLLFALLDLDQDRFRHASVVQPRMDFARLQEDSPQIGDALLRNQHLVVGLNHGSSSSTIPGIRKWHRAVGLYSNCLRSSMLS
jgi:hypothetical protein